MTAPSYHSQTYNARKSSGVTPSARPRLMRQSLARSHSPKWDVRTGLVLAAPSELFVTVWRQRSEKELRIGPDLEVPLVRLSDRRRIERGAAGGWFCWKSPGGTQRDNATGSRFVKETPT